MSGGSKKQTVGYKYSIGMHMAMCHGPIDKVSRISVADSSVWTGDVSSGRINIDAGNVFGGEEREGGVSGAVDLATGEASQGSNDYLRSVLGSTIPAFRGIACLILRQVYIGTNPYVKPWAVTVQRILKSDYGLGQWYPDKAVINTYDMNPSHIIRECLTSPVWGMGYNSNDIDADSFIAAADTLYSEGFGLSLLWNQQMTIEDFISEILKHIDATLYLNRSTGLFELLLIRGDYDVSTLTTLDESNIESIESYSKPTVSELVSGVTVKYWDRSANGDSTLTVNDIAIANQQGTQQVVVNEYAGITTDSLAAQVATRDLRTLSTPLLTCTINTNNTVGDLKSGDVFILSWEKYGVSNAVMRVRDVKHGEFTDNRIKIEAIQDVYAFTEAVYQQPPGTEWTEPKRPPAPPENRLDFEIPYYVVASLLGDNAAQAIDDTSAFFGLGCQSPSSDAFNARALIEQGGVYEDIGVVDFSPGGILADDIDYLSDSLTLENYDDIDFLDVGEILQVGEEIVEVLSVEEPVIGIARGVMDTVPAKHAAGTKILAWFDGGFVDTEEVKLVGETVRSKILPTTGLGTLEEANAVTDTVVMVGRMHKPYPPGNFKINGAYYPSVSTVDVHTLTWAHRDRLSQTAGFNDFYEGSIGPEANTEYEVLVLGEDDSTALTDVSVTDTTLVTDSRQVEAVSTPNGLVIRVVGDGNEGGGEEPEEGYEVTAKSVVFDFADNRGENSYLGVRSIEFYLGDFRVDLTLSNITVYATGEYNNNFLCEQAFDPLTSKIGTYSTHAWLSAAPAEQRLIVVFNDEVTFDRVVVNNGHMAGTETNHGVKTTKITSSTVTVTSTVYDEEVPDSTVLFEGDVAEHVAENVVDDQMLYGAPKAATTAKSIVFDCTDNWGGSYFCIRTIEFFLDGELVDITHYTADDSSNSGSSYSAQYAFDGSGKTGGTEATTIWLSASGVTASQRIFIVPDDIIRFDSIVINNGHFTGGSTNNGVKNLIITTLDREITSTTYRHDVQDGSVVFSGVIPEHVTENVEDDYVIPVSLPEIEALPSYTAKSFVLDMTDNWGHASYIGITAVDFYLRGAKLELTQTDFTVYADDSITSGGYYPYYVFDTTITKVGHWSYNSVVHEATAEKRIICVFNDEIEFDAVVVNNVHSSGTSTTCGVKNAIMTITPNEVTDLTYGLEVPDGSEIFSGELFMHQIADVEDEYNLPLTVEEEEEEQEPVTYYTAKSVIIDIADNWGSGTYLSLRSVEFFLGGTLIDMDDTNSTAYATTLFSDKHEPSSVFDTSLSKTGSWEYNQWVSASQNSTQRLIIVFDTEQDFDELVINNGHYSGSWTAAGSKNAVITISDDEITDITYEGAITNSTEIFAGELPEHAAVDEADDYDVPIVTPGPPLVITAKSVVIDIADSWGGPNFLGIRSVEFLLDGVLIDMDSTKSVVYYTTQLSATYPAEKTFDTSLAKTSSYQGRQWLSDSGETTEQRLVIVFNDPQEFDQIITNNSHHNGGETIDGAKNIVITASTDEITDATYQAEITNSTEIFSGEIPEHVAENVEDDYTVPIGVPVMIPPVRFTDVKSVIIDIADSWGNATYMGIRSVEFWNEGTLVEFTEDVNFAAYATSYHDYTAYREEFVFDTSISKIGGTSSTTWLATSGSITDQRIILVADTAFAFDKVIVNNVHNSGTFTDTGVKNIVITASTDEITSTVYQDTITNGAEVFAGEVPEHVAEDVIDDYIVYEEEPEEPEVPEFGTQVKSVIIDCADTFTGAAQVGLRRVMFYLRGGRVDVDVVGFTADATTTYYAGSLPEFAFSMTAPLTGATANASWYGNPGTKQRLLIVFDTPVDFDEIVIHNAGGNHTSHWTYGVKNGIITTSTEEVTDTTYLAAVPGGTVIYDEEFPPHTSEDIEDSFTVDLAEVLPLVPGATIAKSVIIDIADNWGDSSLLALRSVEFYKDGYLIGLPVTAFFSDCTSHYSNSTNYFSDNAFDTTRSKIGTVTFTQWYSNSVATNQRLLVVFDTEVEFDEIIINNGHDSGTKTTRGIKNVRITASTDEITSTVYQDFIPNYHTVFTGEVPEHVAVDEVDDYSVQVLVPEVPVVPEVPPNVVAKSVVFDIADNWSSVSHMGVRSVEFFLDGSLIDMDDTKCTVYYTSRLHSAYSASYVFDTSLSKLGSYYNTQWLSDSGKTTEQRLVIVFNDVQEFDELVINNGHHLGGETTIGIKNIVITASTDEITSNVYQDPITNGAEIFAGVFPEHVAEDIEDDYDVPIVIPEPVEPTGIVAKTIRLDIADTWGGAQFLGLRSVDFTLGGVSLGLVATDFIAYATTIYSGSYDPSNVFDTSLSKTGTNFDNEWITTSYDVTDQAILIVVNDESILFDGIVINNSHKEGGDTDRGAQNVVITTSTEAVISASDPLVDPTEIFAGVLPEHVAVDTIDDYDVPITLAPPPSGGGPVEVPWPIVYRCDEEVTIELNSKIEDNESMQGYSVKVERAGYGYRYGEYYGGIE